MSGSLDQLMRLLSNRGLEWLRQRIMALPDPCPPDHPELGALAMVAEAAPVLSGLRGRISPIEVIVARRLTPDLVRAGARRVLAGDRGPGLVRLMLAGGLVARHDPLWHLACEALADDDALPLAQRLALSDDPALMTAAEGVLTAPPARIDAGHVAAVCDLVMQIYRGGSCRPRLSHPRAYARVFDHLLVLADWAGRHRCTASRARTAFALRLLDPEHSIAETTAELIQAQRPDGAFPPRLGYGTADQPFAEAAEATVQVALALHMAAWRRWRGAPPVWLRPQPLRAGIQGLAARLAAVEGPEAGDLATALLLTRATGANWFPRMRPPRGAEADQLAHLARLGFRDPLALRHLRHWLDLPRAALGGPAPGATPVDPASLDTALAGGPLPGAPAPVTPAPITPAPITPGRTIAGIERACLGGAALRIDRPRPAALTALWDLAARRGDVPAYLDCAHLALHHAEAPATPAIRRMGRQIAAEAMGAPDDRPALSRALARLLLLAPLLEPEMPAAAAA